MDKLLKQFKGYSQDRESYSNFFADSEMMEIEKVIYVDYKNERVLKFEDDLDSDNEKHSLQIK